MGQRSRPERPDRRRGRARHEEESIASRRRRRTAALLRGGRVETARIGQRPTHAKGRAGFLDGAGAVIAAALQQRVGLAVTDIAGDVTAVVVEIGAERQRAVERRAVDDAALRITVARDGSCAGIEQRRQEFVTIIVLINAVIAVEPDSGEILVHDEVDDARDRVRAVGRRRAAGQHFDALDQRRRDEVEIGGRAVGIARHQATAVDQHQRAGRTETAQVDGRRARRAIRQRRRLTGVHLRQRVEQILNLGRARQLDVLAGDGRDRSARGQVGLRNARAGNDDFVAGGDRRAGGGGRRNRLRFDRAGRIRRVGRGAAGRRHCLADGGSGEHARANQQGGREKSLAEVKCHELNPLADTPSAQTVACNHSITNLLSNTRNQIASAT